MPASHRSGHVTVVCGSANTLLSEDPCVHRHPTCLERRLLHRKKLTVVSGRTSDSPLDQVSTKSDDCGRCLCTFYRKVSDLKPHGSLEEVEYCTFERYRARLFRREAQYIPIHRRIIAWST